jgi:hypothetical protein
MKYSSSINSLLNYFKDTSFWQLNQYSNELKNYRQDLSGQWDDNAASEIQHQYLNPHEEDEIAMRGWFEKQYQTIQQLTLNLDQVETVNINILSISEEIRILTSDSEEDLRKAVTNFDFSSNRKNDAETKIPTITSLLSSANQGEYTVSY